MKKFAFSLHVLFENKKSMKNKLQLEFAAAKAALDKALCVKVALDKIYMEESEKYEAKAKKGTTPGDMEAHVIYFEELQDMIKTAVEDINRAQEDMMCKQTALIEICKEIKVLEKLWQKQYVEYLTEEKKQAATISEEILAFHVSGKPAQRSGSRMRE